ncbi:corticostatin-3 isoform X2 [Oryctolagus cuniculus]|uniref:Mammalian defensins domain-containing protein n=1 Tax=Oryctolagus cuniculus TaxID=9986 RepID=G1T7N7_RABIT|nr:corticostatin-3 isoform X1 [Oryctolagus cuniculus]
MARAEAVIWTVVTVLLLSTGSRAVRCLPAMRTLALLAAILLVALQAQAEHISVSIDEVVDQQPAQAEDQDVAIYVKEHESSALEALGAKTGGRCVCRKQLLCSYRERRIGDCKIRGVRFPFCCPR